MNFNYNQIPYPQGQGISNLNPFINNRINYSQLNQGLNWNNPSVRVRPVSSIDEVRASSIDFDGSIFYFPDTSNKKIYTKQINMDGSSSIFMYNLQETPIQSSSTQTSINLENFVSKEEFSNTISLLVEEIKKMKGANNNVQQSDTTNDATKPQF